MKLPKSVNILGLIIPIKMDKEMASTGEYLGVKNLIKISPDQPKQDMLPTLLHEMAHAALARVEVTFLTVNEEEVIVDNITKVIHENFNLTPRKLKCCNCDK